MKKLTLLLITLCMLITTTYAYNVIKTVNQNQLITTVNSGEVVTVTYSDVAGYTFNGWSVTGVSIANLSSKQIVFTMPANDVTIEPNMVKDEKYALTWIINNVTHVLEKAPGDSVTLTANDTEGYTFTNWTATGIMLQDTSAKTINFTMPSNDVTLVANFEESAHVHEYSAATCTVPPTCSCGETTGNALGHSWNNATCTEAKTCSVCGETTGNALGHTWVNATCTEAKTCSVCGETTGNALGHTWVNATCTEAKTCSVCSATEGSALNHSYTGTRTCNQNGTNDTVKCVRYGTGGCTASENQTCTHTYTITVTQGSNGTISPSTTTVKAGGSQTFSITANSGYEVSDVKVNGTSVGAKTSYTFSSVKSNQTITASFTQKVYTWRRYSKTTETIWALSPSLNPAYTFNLQIMNEDPDSCYGSSYYITGDVLYLKNWDIIPGNQSDYSFLKGKWIILRGGDSYNAETMGGWYVCLIGQVSSSVTPTADGDYLNITFSEIYDFDYHEEEVWVYNRTVTSTDRNAYPDNGVQGNYKYEFVN